MVNYPSYSATGVASLRVGLVCDSVVESIVAGSGHSRRL